MPAFDPRTELEQLADEYTTRVSAIERDLSRTHSQSFAEQATQRQNDMVLHGLLDEARKSLHDARKALERLDEGEYGLCQGCGEEINSARLQIMPATAYCINCADKAQEINAP